MDGERLYWFIVGFMVVLGVFAVLGLVEIWTLPKRQWLVMKSIIEGYEKAHAEKSGESSGGGETP